MTLEKLLQLKFTASELQKLNDAELEALLSPKFQVTRPDKSKWKDENKKIAVPKTTKLRTSAELEKEAKLSEAKRLVMQKLGIKL